MKTSSKTLLLIFALISAIDLFFTSKALSQGYTESHLLSGFQYGFWVAAILKSLEIAIVLLIVRYSEISIDDRYGIPSSSAIAITSILFALAGASCTFLAIPGLI